MKLALLGVSVLIVAAAPLSRAQATSNKPMGNNTSQPATDPFRPHRPGDPTVADEDATNAFFRRHMEEARKNDRRKRMVDTANRLLTLTKQLQSDLEGRQATPEDEKRLDEIARLARQVKDQMRQ